jgi:hypothetical protein
LRNDPERRVRSWLAKSCIAFDCPPLPVEMTARFDREFDVFWAEHRDQHEVTVERSAAFLNWRHVELPSFVGRCSAFSCREHGRLMGYLTLQQQGYSNRNPDCFVVTDLVYPIQRPEVLHNLMNEAFRFVPSMRGNVLKLTGFHPVVYAAMASQRPIVIDPATLRTFASSGVAGVFRPLRRPGARKRRNATRRVDEGSYWFKAPRDDRFRALTDGSWWPTGIDGTTNL